MVELPQSGSEDKDESLDSSPAKALAETKAKQGFIVY